MGAERVVVAGGGFGGLCAALALARGGIEVTLVEGDPLPELGSADAAFALERPGATQVHQTHGFLARIILLLREHLPDLLDALLAEGCTTMSGTAALGEPQPGDEDLAVLLVRRSTFEWVLRRAVAAEPAVVLRSGARVAGLVPGRRRGAPAVDGVVLEDGTELAGPVVAATGRRGDVAAWLAPIGATVRERVDESGLVYLTRWYRSTGRVATPPTPKAGGDLEFLKYLVVPGDGAMVSATLAVPAGDRVLRRALADPDSFDRAARALPGPNEWLEGLDLEPVGAVRPMGGLLNRIRHFTEPDGRPSVVDFHALGDAHTCTNPLYGRGCSLALLQAVRLAEAMVGSDDPSDRALCYEEACRTEVAPWWRHAVEMDRSGADPGGGRADRAAGERLGALMAASQSDPVVGRAMARLWNLLALPSELEADEVFAARAAAIMGDPERYPAPVRTGPSRDELLATLAA